MIKIRIKIQKYLKKRRALKSLKKAVLPTIYDEHGNPLLRPPEKRKKKKIEIPDWLI